MTYSIELKTAEFIESEQIRQAYSWLEASSGSISRTHLGWNAPINS